MSACLLTPGGAHIYNLPGRACHPGMGRTCQEVPASVRTSMWAMKAAGVHVRSGPICAFPLPVVVLGTPGGGAARCAAAVNALVDKQHLACCVLRRVRRPAPHPLTTVALEPAGAYLLDSGRIFVLWLGRAVSADFMAQVWLNLT